MNGLPIEFAGTQLWLLPERALWQPDTQTLLVADVHIGKGTSFRQRGMAVPTGSSAVTLARLAALVEVTGAHRLIVLGDFFMRCLMLA